MKIGKHNELSTSKVTAFTNEGYDWLIEFKHEDFPFTCLVHDRCLGKNFGTTGIQIADSDIRKILRDKGYTNNEHIKQAKERVEHRKKYGDMKDVEAPKKITLGKADEKKLESFYQKWFEYHNTTYFVPLMEALEQINQKCDVNKTKIQEILDQCSKSRVAEKSEYKVVNDSTLTNDYARLEFSESSDRVSLELNDWKFTDEQKIKLFIFLDSLEKYKR